jgi:phosphoribosylcarboxyaminoimidazole (NCAIR) mutase
MKTKTIRLAILTLGLLVISAPAQIKLIIPAETKPAIVTPRNIISPADTQKLLGALVAANVVKLPDGIPVQNIRVIKADLLPDGSALIAVTCSTTNTPAVAP